MFKFLLDTKVYRINGFASLLFCINCKSILSPWGKIAGFPAFAKKNLRLLNELNHAYITTKRGVSMSTK
jgi:hypothetical protein